MYGYEGTAPQVFLDSSYRLNLQLLLNFQLMKLDKDYLKLHHIEKLKQQVDEQKNKLLSKLSLRIQMQKDSFNKLSFGGYFNIDTWAQPFMFIKSCEINL